MDQKLTIWQRLGDVFRDKTPQVRQVNQYNIDPGELLRTSSKEDFNVQKLQKQQTTWLHNQWVKVDSEMFQQAIYFETTRIAAYSDFEAMEFYPELGTALDIMMEESCTVNEKGKMLNIYSESDRVKKILEDLFYKRINIHTSLPMWTRNTAKYGDNFVYLNMSDTDGIVGVKQLPNIEIERWEGDLYSTMNQLTNTDGSAKPNEVKFIWKTREHTFKPWQIAHFRLLTDDRRLPYGVSMLEKARRIYKQLMLAEDAMLIYRVTRAPERRVFKVFVGNLDDPDIEPYVNQVANKFKRTPLIDPQTGQMNLRYNQLSQDQDFFVPVRSHDQSNPIDTLPGAQNLSEIQDIEYLQKKMFTAIRVPKTFLGFEEAVGEGKNLALQDIRFARTINRIQQAMLQELNKIAIIHLFILGLDDELDNFTLTLNNPSTQAEMLKIEHTTQKIQLYKDAVTDAGNGFAPMSMTKAKKDILNMSNSEIILDLEQQRIEKAAAAELANTASVIKTTGLFNKVDKLYGEPGAKSSTEPPPENESAGGGSFGAGGGSFGGGGGSLDTTIGGGADLSPAPIEPEASMATEEPGSPPLPGESTPTEPGEITPESIIKTENLLLEHKLNSRKEKYSQIYFDRLLEYYDEKELLSENIEDTIIENENKTNKKIDELMNDIDKIIDN